MKKEKHPIQKIRRKMAPPTKKMPNPKKEESRKACRNKNEDNTNSNSLDKGY